MYHPFSIAETIKTAWDIKKEFRYDYHLLGFGCTGADCDPIGEFYFYRDV